MSGLATVRGLTLAGHEVVCYEAGSALGGMWRYCNDTGTSAAYASLRANTSRRRMQFPSLPMPDSMSEFPHHSEVLAYLEQYAQANNLLRHVTFGARVEAARPSEHGWEVSVPGERPAFFDSLVVASGHYWDPEIPSIPGDFHGTVLHARDYRTPDRFADQRVVVVGAAQSALDIAAELTTTATVVRVALRQRHHLLPRRLLGRPFDSFDNAATLLAPLPVIRSAARALMWAGRARPDGGDLPAARHRLFESRWPVAVGPELERALATRAFHSRPAIQALDGDRVRFTDGTEEEADAVLFATGYRINFPFLPADLGRGHGWEFPLYRRVLSPHAAGLAFIGVLEPGPGLFAIVERQADWLAAVLAGQLDLPTAERMWQAIDNGGEPRSRRQFATTGGHTLLCNRHAYLRTLDRDLRRVPPQPSPARSRRGRANRRAQSLPADRGRR